MATSYTSKLQGYTPNTYPSLGNEQRYLVQELSKLSNAINNIIAVMQLLEKRMNTDGLA